MRNYVQRFLMEELDIRGAVVKLDSVWHQLIQKRTYDEKINQLLGQMSVTTLFFAENLKHSGRLTLQLRADSTSPLSLLVVDCTAPLNIRCMAQYEGDISDIPTIDLLKKGQLSLVIETPASKEAYQSLVPVEGENVAEIFENYLKQSEQLASRFFLAASPDCATGLFIQKMPDADAKDSDGWNRVETLAETVKDSELLSLSANELLSRLFPEEDIRLFESSSVIHDYPKNWEKVENMLLALGKEEVSQMLDEEKGTIVINDDLSGHEYRFDQAKIDAIFSENN